HHARLAVVVPDASRSPAAAAIWSAARVARIELGPCLSHLIELTTTSEMLRAVLAGPPGEYRIRRGGVDCPRLRRVTAIRSPGTLAGTGLVAGGTGAVGLAFSRWLLASGARRVVIAARSRPAEPLPTHVEFVTMDVTLPEHVSRAVAHAGADDDLSGV